MKDKKKDYNEGKYVAKNKFTYGNKKELSLEELKAFAGGRTIEEEALLDNKPI